MTAQQIERLVGIPEALEIEARLIAAARGEDLDDMVITFLQEYLTGHAA
jgi:hypothetical protein